MKFRLLSVILASAMMISLSLSIPLVSADYDTSTKISLNVADDDIIADFSYYISNLDVDFNDKSSGEISDWYWEFGDGEYSHEQNPSHTYDKEGYYNVTLFVTNGDYTTKVTKTIFVGSGSWVWSILLWFAAIIILCVIVKSLEVIKKIAFGDAEW